MANQLIICGGEPEERDALIEHMKEEHPDLDILTADEAFRQAEEEWDKEEIWNPFET